MLEWATMAWRERIIFYGSGLRSYFARRAETYPHKMFSLPQYARNAPFLLRKFFIIGRTDGETPDRCFTLAAIDAASVINQWER